MKRPDFLIINQGLNTLDGRSQQKIIETVLAKAKGRDGNRFGVIWAPMNMAFSKMFDRVLVFKQGVLVDDGSPEELLQSSSEYVELVGS